MIVIFGALEHKVLEQVRKPCPTWFLVLRPAVIPEVNRNDRAGVIDVYDDVEPVVQCLFIESDLHGVTRQQAALRPPGFGSGCHTRLARAAATYRVLACHC